MQFFSIWFAIATVKTKWEGQSPSYLKNNTCLKYHAEYNYTKAQLYNKTDNIIYIYSYIGQHMIISLMIRYKDDK